MSRVGRWLLPGFTGLVVAFLFAPIVVMIAAGYVADALWPTLVVRHPLWLLGLSARNRYVLLVVNRGDLWAYYLWGTLRLLLPDPFFFALGWFYGPAALRWMERRTPTVGSTMRKLERAFGKLQAKIEYSDVDELMERGPERFLNEVLTETHAASLTLERMYCLT